MGPMLTLTIVVLVALATGYAVTAAALIAIHGAVQPVDELHHVEAGGGWEVALHRLRPGPASVARRLRGGAPAPEHPVVLAHGIAMSSRFWHLRPEMSLARYLSARGHDVWIAEVRGSGESRHVGGGDPWDFSFDHLLREDAPAIIDYVCKLTASEEVDWVGHSMGGMILYGYALLHGTDRLHRTVTIGSPARMSSGGHGLPVPGVVTRLLLRGSRLPLYTLTRLGLPLCVYARQRLMPTFYNPRLISGAEIAYLFSRGVMDLSVRHLRQFEGWTRSGRMELEDGETRVERGPAAIDVPLLVLAGAGDRLVPPRMSRPAFDVCPAEDRRLRVFGGADDPAPPLGHVDLVASHEGARWVYPEVARWLEGRKPPGPRAGEPLSRRTAEPAAGQRPS